MRADDVHDTVVDMRHEAAALIVERAVPLVPIMMHGMLNSLIWMLAAFWVLKLQLMIGF